MVDTFTLTEKCSPLELLTCSSSASTSTSKTGISSCSPLVLPARATLPELSRALLYATDSLVYELALWPLGFAPRAADLSTCATPTHSAGSRAARLADDNDKDVASGAAAYAAALVAAWDGNFSLRRSCGRRVFCELVWLNAASFSSDPLSRAPFFALSSGTSHYSISVPSTPPFCLFKHNTQQYYHLSSYHQCSRNANVYQMIARTTGKRSAARV